MIFAAYLRGYADEQKRDRAYNAVAHLSPPSHDDGDPYFIPASERKVEHDKHHHNAHDLSKRG